MGVSLLEQYIASSHCEDVPHVFTRFDKSLKINTRPNTQVAYNTDVYSVFRDVLFYFYDFPDTYDSIAGHLALVHVLDQADVGIATGRLSADKGKALLASVQETGSHSPYLTSQQIQKQQRHVVNLLGQPITFNRRGHRFRMQLRSPSFPPPNVAVRKEDVQMINYVSAFFDPSVNDHISMDGEFWLEVLRQDRLGEVFEHQRRNGNTNNTVARKLAALQRFEDFLYNGGTLSKRVIRDIKRPVIIRSPQTWLSGDELQTLYAHYTRACKVSRGDAMLSAYRNRAMYSLLATTLMRGTALAHIELDHLDMKRKRVYVVEKGRKERLLPLTTQTINDVSQWLRVRSRFLERFLDSSHAPHLFYTCRGKPMNRRSLSRILDEGAEEAGIITKKRGMQRAIGTHTVRRSSARDMYTHGARILELQELLGHVSIVTTMQYIGEEATDISKTVEMYSPLKKKRKK